MARWLAVTTADNWDRCVATQTWGVVGRYEQSIRRVAADDEILVYLVGMKCAGIFRVTEPYLYNEDPIWPDDVYPHRVRFESLLAPPEPVDMRQFFYSFFPNMSPQGFFRSAFRVLPDDQFELFREFLESGQVRTLEFAVVSASPAEAAFALSLERDLEDYLEKNLQVIEPGLRLYKEGEIKGRQFGTDVNRIDLLAQDPSGNFAVIELKAGEADRSVLGQILPYMGWVREHLAKQKAVRGIVIASEFSADLLAAINVLSNLSLYRYSVQFSFSKAAPVAPMAR